jgi:hypothetical protein
MEFEGFCVAHRPIGPMDPKTIGFICSAKLGSTIPIIVSFVGLAGFSDPFSTVNILLVGLNRKLGH